VSEHAIIERSMTSHNALQLIGQTFGQLTVVESAGKTSSGNIRWQCQCSCGTVKVIAGTALRSGDVRSCGCLRDSKVRLLNRTHGLSGTRTYRSWEAMWARCTQLSHIEFPRYGAKGISVCSHWEKFENFLTDMGLRPDGMTLDRFPNAKGNYEPGNCRWATAKEQMWSRQ
jgi:hypothetical protein